MRIFIAEDQLLLRNGLQLLLESFGDEVVGLAVSGPEIVPGVKSTKPDIAILDIRMPPTNTDEGLRAAAELRSELPGFPILLLSQYVELLYLDELLEDRTGGIGYLLKDRVLDEEKFHAQVLNVCNGGTSVDPNVISELLTRKKNRTRLEELTEREQEVLALMAEGQSNPEIMEALFVTEKTVAKHINNIFSKLGLPPTGSNSRRVLAVLAYLQR